MNKKYKKSINQLMFQVNIYVTTWVFIISYLAVNTASYWTFSLLCSGVCLHSSPT